jgi:hypothetical protein
MFINYYHNELVIMLRTQLCKCLLIINVYLYWFWYIVDLNTISTYDHVSFCLSNMIPSMKSLKLRLRRKGRHNPNNCNNLKTARLSLKIKKHHHFLSKKKGQLTRLWPKSIVLTSWVLVYVHVYSNVRLSQYGMVSRSLLIYKTNQVTLLFVPVKIEINEKSIEEGYSVVEKLVLTSIFKFGFH